MILETLAVILLGFTSSFLSNISGGGGALITLPALIALGIPPLEAIGSIKIGALGLVFGSVAKLKGTDTVRKDYLYPLIAIAITASILGPQISTQLNDEAVKLISSIFIVITACASLASWKLASNNRNVSKLSRRIGYFLYFLTLTVLSGFGSGLGILINYVLIGFLGMTALETLSTRRVVGLIGLPLQLIAFVVTGHFNLAVGLALLVGSLAGGYLGLHVAIKRGNEFVKKAMAIASILLVLSLFL